DFITNDGILLSMLCERLVLRSSKIWAFEKKR
uniref:Uncharacterized protein n=1 Tax=Amphimedon queenslandica TaxID=400682 RepID=A0A1X7TBU8_AMPQE